MEGSGEHARGEVREWTWLALASWAPSGQGPWAEMCLSQPPSRPLHSEALGLSPGAGFLSAAQCCHWSWDVLFIALTLYFEVLPLFSLRGRHERQALVSLSGADQPLSPPSGGGGVGLGLLLLSPLPPQAGGVPHLNLTLAPAPSPGPCQEGAAPSTPHSVLLHLTLL